MLLRAMLAWSWLGALLRVVGGEPTPAPTQLVAPWATWRYQTLREVAPPEGWHLPGFDDRSWPSGMAGFSVGHFGYAQTASSLPMWAEGSAVRVLVMRREFVLAEPDAVGALFLRLEYEDGVRVWLNGVEVVRRGFREEPPPSWSTVPTPHPPVASEVFDLTASRELWKAGTNLLAILVGDSQVGAATLYAWPELRRDFLRGPTVQEVLTHSAVVAWEVPVGVRTWLEWQAPGEAGFREFPSPAPGPVHALRRNALASGAQYRYRVGAQYPDGRVVRSEVAEFRTLRESGHATFLVVGDTGAGLDDQYDIAAQLQREPADFVLHTGDIVYPAFTAGKADLRCLSIYEAQMRTIPWYFTLGNHDINGGDLSYRDLLWQPVNSLTGSELFYSFDHGDVHVVCLFVPWWGISRLGVVGADGSRDPQYQWLTRDLAATTKPWKVVFFHQPPKTSGPHGYDDYDLDGRFDVTQMQEAFVPLLASLGVDVVFNGHDHDWERFAPVQGVHFVVTGGGGAIPYGIYRREAGSARHVTAHHLTRVRTSADRMFIEALDANGRVFDQLLIGRASETRSPLDAVWHERADVGEPVSNGDGNRVGERFDLEGDDRAGVPGLRANPGRLLVDVDREMIRFGLREVMLWPDQTLMLWLGTTARRGVTNLAGVGVTPLHPIRDLPLRFEEFSPSLVALLGDERADGTFPDFARPTARLALGQGVFRLESTLSPVPRARLRQFNRSPEGIPDPDEQNADFIVVSVPRSELGWPGPDDLVQAAVVVVSPSSTEALGEGDLSLDTAYLGAAFTPSGVGIPAVLSPILVKLPAAPGPDEDADGLVTAEEKSLGTDPRKPDSDGDGLPDGWEVAHRLNPLSAEGLDGGAGDVDGDGYLNHEEWASGTDPRDATPTLAVSATRVSGGSGRDVLRVHWRAMVGRRYVLESAARVSGPFEAVSLPGFPRVAISTQESVDLEIEASGPQGAPERWYRLREGVRSP